MKNMLAVAWCALALAGARADVVYVKADATGDGSGADWANACTTFDAGVAKLAAGGELWVAGSVTCSAVNPTTLVPTADVIIRGGFVGTESAASDRAANAVSVVDGGETKNLFAVETDAGVGVTVERMVLRNAWKRAIKKTGAGDFTLDGCRIESNGRHFTWSQFADQVDGRGVYVEGAGAVTVTNCVFAGNGQQDKLSASEYGLALYLKSCAQASVDATLFVTNGPSFAATVAGGDKSPYSTGANGTAICANGSPITVRNSRFIGNRAQFRSACGGVVRLENNCGGSAFTNCLFLANEHVAGYPGTQIGQSSFKQGTLTVVMDTEAREVDVVNCTFAYNLSSSQYSGAGLSVATGTAHVRNSVFYNFVNYLCGTAADITADTTGHITLDYTVAGTEKMASCYASKADGIVYGDEVVFGDPSFVTPLATMTACTLDSAGSTFRYNPAFEQTVVSADAHLQSKKGYWLNDGTKVTDGTVDSIAIDAGDPSFACVEPIPNGSRVNCGFYGNTAEASNSEPATPVIGAITIDFPGGYSRPDISFTMSGTTEAAYSATVTVLYGTGDVATDGYSCTNVFTGVHNGDAILCRSGTCFAKGSTLSVQVVAKVAGQAAVESPVATTAVTGDYPPWWTAKGPANVIHVREGALGPFDGRSWRTAYATLAAAFADISETRDEIWVAGRFVPESICSAAPTVPFALRGGFTGAENAATDRADGAVSTLDANGNVNLLDFDNAAGSPVTVERMILRNAFQRALNKTGTGDLIVKGCRFEANGRNYGLSVINGRGICAVGGGVASVTVTNCTFAGNGQQGTLNAEVESGVALYLESCANAFVDKTLFLTNGPAWDAFQSGDSNPYSRGVNGMAVCAKNTRLTLRNDRFIGNRAQFRNSNGGVVRFQGSSGGSALTNCLFVANEHIPGYPGTQKGQSDYGQGAISLYLTAEADAVDIVNCTVAYNLSSSQYGAAGLSAKKGTANVRNSVFYSNFVDPNISVTATDITADTTGHVNLRYTLAGASSAAWYSAQAGNITTDASVFYGDPSFVTPQATVSPFIKTDSPCYRFDAARVVELLAAVDVHLKSKKGYWLNDGTKVTDGTVDSIALDAGDPEMTCVEPIPNGSRVNCGVYGNTAEASHTDPATPVIGEVTVDFPDGISRPDISFDMSGTTADDYTATVYIYYGTGDVATAGYTFTNVISGVHNGDHILFKSPEYLLKGDTLTVLVSALVAGVPPVVKPAVETEVTGELPPWWNTKGPAWVVHARAGAMGKATGDSWKDAVPDFTTALTRFLADETKREIWLAGDFVAQGPVSTTVIPRALVIRGGFTGAEETAAARDPSRMATLDGDTRFDLLDFSNAASAPVEIDRVVFVRAYGCALKKSSGAGDLTLRDCRFVYNGAWVGNTVGNACYVKGADAARFVVSNCVFAGNILKNENVTGKGGAICVESFARLTVDDSLFVTNGLSVLYGDSYGVSGCNGFPGGAIFAKNTPTTLRNVAFRGNRCTTRYGSGTTAYNNGNQGGIVQLYGACGGSAFTNCLFTGNANTTGCSWQHGYSCGAVVIDFANKADVVDIVNTTIAYNTGASALSGAGLTVVKGTANVVSSILYGNIRHATSTAGADLFVLPDGVANVRYSFFTANSTDSVSALEGGALTLGAGLLTDVLPRFVTPIENVRSLVTYGSNCPLFKRDLATRHAVSSFNVHLRGQGYTDELTGEPTPRYPWNDRSPAIDAGDPASQVWRGEPRPNGHRLNMGAYGGTPWATRFRPGAAILIR